MIKKNFYFRKQSLCIPYGQFGLRGGGEGGGEGSKVELDALLKIALKANCV